MTDQFSKDIKRSISNTPIGELAPGSTPRRYEPEGGLRRHNERIHRESGITDDHKNLPFTFSKPHKPKGRSTYIRCDNCGRITSATTATVGMVCPDCGKFSTVTEITGNEAGS